MKDQRGAALQYSCRRTACSQETLQHPRVCGSAPLLTTAQRRIHQGAAEQGVGGFDNLLFKGLKGPYLWKTPWGSQQFNVTHGSLAAEMSPEAGKHMEPEKRLILKILYPIPWEKFALWLSPYIWEVLPLWPLGGSSRGVRLSGYDHLI